MIIVEQAYYVELTVFVVKMYNKRVKIYIINITQLLPLTITLSHDYF